VNQLLAHSKTFSNQIQKNASFRKKLIDCYMFGNFGFFFGKFKIQLEFFISQNIIELQLTLELFNFFFSLVKNPPQLLILYKISSRCGFLTKEKKN